MKISSILLISGCAIIEPCVGQQPSLACTPAIMHTAWCDAGIAYIRIASGWGGQRGTAVFFRPYGGWWRFRQVENTQSWVRATAPADSTAFRRLKEQLYEGGLVQLADSYPSLHADDAENVTIRLAYKGDCTSLGYIAGNLFIEGKDGSPADQARLARLERLLEAATARTAWREDSLLTEYPDFWKRPSRLVPDYC